MSVDPATGGRIILDELKQRGVEDILISCVDGRKGFEQVIKAVFSKTTWKQISSQLEILLEERLRKYKL